MINSLAVGFKIGCPGPTLHNFQTIKSCQKPEERIGSGAVQQQVANCVASVELTLVSTWWTSNYIATTHIATLVSTWWTSNYIATILLQHCFYTGLDMVD